MPTPLPDRILSMESMLLTWISEPIYWLPSWFTDSWITARTSRSPFFVESDFLEALHQVRQAIDSATASESSEIQKTCCEKHAITRGELLRQMDDVLSSFLDLPVTPIPALPCEILHQIIGWTVAMESASLRLTLISKRVMTWVEPLFWEDNNITLCKVFLRKEIPDRFQHAGKFVRRLIIFRDEDYQSEDFSRLLTRLCNIKCLYFNSFDKNLVPLPCPTLPHLTRFSLCSPLIFGVVGNDGFTRPDFSTTLFENLTHLDLDFRKSLLKRLSTDWQWSFELMVHLQFLRFYLHLDQDRLTSFLSFFTKGMLPRFPISLRGCLIHGERASPMTVDIFLMLDPRIVWAFVLRKTEEQEGLVELFLSRTRAVLYDWPDLEAELSNDVWCKEIVKAIEMDKR